MKDPNDPVSDGEFILRRVLNKQEHYDQNCPDPVQYGAFSPSSEDDDGISMFREACGATPELVATAANPAGYHVVRFKAKDLKELGITLKPTPSASTIPGHISIPEISIGERKRNKAACKQLERKLSQLASKSEIILYPGKANDIPNQGA